MLNLTFITIKQGMDVHKISVPSTCLNSTAHAKGTNLSFDFLMCLKLEDVWLNLHMFLDQTQDFDHRKDSDYQHVVLKHK